MMKGILVDKQKILTTLAHNVRQEMNAADFSSVELARRCHISTGTISKILQGKMSISVECVIMQLVIYAQRLLCVLRDY
jgi:hypothetical protein